MRMHMICWNDRDDNGNIKRLPRKYNRKDHEDKTHIYDVGIDELSELCGLFDHVVVVEWGDVSKSMREKVMGLSRHKKDSLWEYYKGERVVIK